MIFEIELIFFLNYLKELGRLFGTHTISHRKRVLDDFYKLNIIFELEIKFERDSGS